MKVRDIKPMLAPKAPVKPFTDPEWLFEVKWDGFRTLAGLGRAGVELRSRDGLKCTSWFPEVVDALALIPGEHIVDGEACVLDAMGGSDRDKLDARVTKRRWVPNTGQVTLMAFDLLVHAGENVMDLPLARRKALLRRLLRDAPKAAVLYVEHYPADARLFQKMVLALQLEGFMAKRRDSIYTPGERNPAWRKIKRAGAVQKAQLAQRLAP